MIGLYRPAGFLASALDLQISVRYELAVFVPFGDLGVARRSSRLTDLCGCLAVRSLTLTRPKNITLAWTFMIRKSIA